MSDTTQDRLAQIAQRVEAVADEVVRLAEGGRWTMRVPAEERDSDIVLMGLRGGALDMHAALTAVLALHRPGEGSSSGYTGTWYGPIEPYCAGCEASDEYAVAHPCPTVRAINDALGGE
jgi:hypothetical protein